MIEEINYLVLGTIESFMCRYFIIVEDGSQKPDVKIRDLVRKSQVAFRLFFHDHGLFKVDNIDKNGIFIDREYYKDNITKEGLEMFKRKALNWAGSKSAQKEPPDYRRLEKILRDIMDK